MRDDLTHISCRAMQTTVGADNITFVSGFTCRIYDTHFTLHERETAHTI